MSETLNVEATVRSLECTYDLALLARSRAQWDRSPALRAAYGDIYLAMSAHAAPGPALEIGSGCGSMRDFVPSVVTSDVCRTPYADRAVSGYAIEQAGAAHWATIYLLDVLHHLREPFRFFASAARALRPGGRLVICDPAATPFGQWFYRTFHHEPIEPERIRAPYEFPADNDAGEFANMGMAWALFERDRNEVSSVLRQFGLHLETVAYRDLVGYPLTGGFSRSSMIPESWIRAIGHLEKRVPRSLIRRAGLRMIVVLEREAVMRTGTERMPTALGRGSRRSAERRVKRASA